MRVIMTGGGTGGHIYPAIAIADKIQSKYPEAEVLFVGTEKGMEKDIVPNNGYPIKFVTVSGLSRKNVLKNFKTFKELFVGIKQAKIIIDEFHPDIVIGTGGYVCGPVVYAAHKKGIKTYIHEQNALPGLTNKILGKYVDKIFISFEESKSYFKNKEKIILSGNPVRKGFIMNALLDNRKKLNFLEDEFVVLCFGGSRGAEKINSAMSDSLAKLSSSENIKIIFITGKTHYEKIINKCKDNKVDLKNIKIMPYTENMASYLAAADLVVSRAGALAVSEIMTCGKPSILIPSPYVANNHQMYNAKVLVDKGGAVLIEEKDLDSEKLTDTIMRLMNNKEALNKMSKASKSASKTDAVDIIYENIHR